MGVSGAPDTENGSILLIEGTRNQDVRLSCSATLGNNCNNAGLVFGYIDGNNFWVKIYSKTQQKCLLYHVSSATWTQKRSKGCTITQDVVFSMTAEVRAGAADEYAATLPAGQVGIWCSNSSDNSFDDFKVRDLAGPFVADGLYFCSNGEVRVDNSNNNVLETYGTDGVEDCIVRRGCPSLLPTAPRGKAAPIAGNRASVRFKSIGRFLWTDPLRTETAGRGRQGYGWPEYRQPAVDGTIPAGCLPKPICIYPWSMYTWSAAGCGCDPSILRLQRCRRACLIQRPLDLHLLAIARSSRGVRQPLCVTDEDEATGAAGCREMNEWCCAWASAALGRCFAGEPGSAHSGKAR